MEQFAKYAEQGTIDENADLKDRQSIVINASIETVWDLLVNVEQWPDWNSHISKVARGSDGKSFSWSDDGRKYKSRFVKTDKPSSLTWLGESGWIKSAYAWTLDRTDENQTVISVEEGYKGILLFLFMSHQKVHSNLLSWLDQLKKVAEEKVETLV